MMLLWQHSGLVCAEFSVQPGSYMTHRGLRVDLLKRSLPRFSDEAKRNADLVRFGNVVVQSVCTGVRCSTAASSRAQLRRWGAPKHSSPDLIVTLKYRAEIKMGRSPAAAALIPFEPLKRIKIWLNRQN
jgi:hypothetical protein